MIINVKHIEDTEWDDLIKKTYGRPYSFQQQDGCKDRGTELITAGVGDFFENDTLDDVVNGNKRGVSLRGWLKADPKAPVKHVDCMVGPTCGQIVESGEQWVIDLWWERNFYPHPSEILQDLFDKGLLKLSPYIINMDW